MRDVIAFRSEIGDFITTTLILVGCALVLVVGIAVVLLLMDHEAADISRPEVDAWCAEYMPDTPRSECKTDTAW